MAATVSAIPLIKRLSALACIVIAVASAAQFAGADAQRPTIGLVLSGGGARGAAHAGVIKVLDELRIPIDGIAGTSMGAIVGGLYASGMSAEELASIVRTADWTTLLTDRPPRARRSFRRKTDDLGFLVNFDLGWNETGIVLPQGFVQGQNLEIAMRRFILPVLAVEDFDALPIAFRAVAADLVSGEQVVLGEGDLATAMRASMSAPGVFKPVRSDGRVLVDGGIANNLPVQVARDMGADVLIVVDVGFGLMPEEQLGSALAVTKQMLTILINARAREQMDGLTPSDVLISPDLGDLESQDFHRLGEAFDIGERAARAARDALAPLGLTRDGYRAHRAALQDRRRPLPHIDAVTVTNESKLSPQVIAARLDDHVGKSLDPAQLEEDIADIYGFDTFETVAYDVVETDAGATLAVRGTEKSWGPNFLRLGLNLEDDFDGDSAYNVAARLTFTEMNPRGGELRAEIQIGDSPRLFAEWYQPLDYAGRWFLNPRVELSRSNFGLFDRGRQIAALRSKDFSLALQGGREFGNWGEIRLGISHARSDSSLRIGMPGIEGGGLDLTGLQASFGYDTIDNVAIPRSGTNVALGWNGVREGLGADLSFDVAEAFLLKPQTFGPHTFLHWWNLRATTNDSSGSLTPFSLGGLFSLSGLAPGELSGRHAGIGRLLYYYRLGTGRLSALDTAVYVGASLELGNVWPDSRAVGWDDTLFAGSAFVVFDTLVGPIYLGYGRAEEGRRSAYLFLGQTF